MVGGNGRQIKVSDFKVITIGGRSISSTEVFVTLLVDGKELIGSAKGDYAFRDAVFNALAFEFPQLVRKRGVFDNTVVLQQYRLERIAKDYIDQLGPSILGGERPERETA